MTANITHIIRNPAGTLSLVGAVMVHPETHCFHRATKQEILAGRKARRPVFEQRKFNDWATAATAVERAGGTVCSEQGCACRDVEKVGYKPGPNHELAF